ncbi:MAG: hypothetical protein AAF442_05480 [Pseudomonadota bacterium]
MTCQHPFRRAVTAGAVVAILTITVMGILAQAQPIQLRSNNADDVIRKTLESAPFGLQTSLPDTLWAGLSDDGIAARLTGLPGALTSTAARSLLRALVVSQVPSGGENEAAVLSARLQVMRDHGFYQDLVRLNDLAGNHLAGKPKAQQIMIEGLLLGTYHDQACARVRQTVQQGKALPWFQRALLVCQVLDEEPQARLTLGVLETLDSQLQTSLPDHGGDEDGGNGGSNGDSNDDVSLLHLARAHLDGLPLPDLPSLNDPLTYVMANHLGEDGPDPDVPSAWQRDPRMSLSSPQTLRHAARRDLALDDFQARLRASGGSLDPLAFAVFARTQGAPLATIAPLVAQATEEDLAAATEPLRVFAAQTLLAARIEKEAQASSPIQPAPMTTAPALVPFLLLSDNPITPALLDQWIESSPSSTTLAVLNAFDIALPQRVWFARSEDTAAQENPSALSTPLPPQLFWQLDRSARAGRAGTTALMALQLIAEFGLASLPPLWLEQVIKTLRLVGLPDYAQALGLEALWLEATQDIYRHTQDDLA